MATKIEATAPRIVPSTSSSHSWIRPFSDIRITDIPLVGGKNAALGEMLQTLTRAGVPVPEGFAITTSAYDCFVQENGLENVILQKSGEDIRKAFLDASIPVPLQVAIAKAYGELSEACGIPDLEVAVRSSATAEDLPGASFAGAHESILNVRGAEELYSAVVKCYASLYGARAIQYRADMGFADRDVKLSVGVQRMVRADDGVSGVIFTLEPESGFSDVVVINGIYGIGENIVQGRVEPDEFIVHKHTLRIGHHAVMRRKLGSKSERLVFEDRSSEHRNIPVSAEDSGRFCLADEDVIQLARWAVTIEEHFSERNNAHTPMDIEFVKEGGSGALFIVQARPETVHSRTAAVLTVFELNGTGTILAEGIAVGSQIATGPAHALSDPSEISEFQPGEVLITRTTNPDWEPILKRASAIVTEEGGRTSHAAIVARELGIPAVVGAANALSIDSGRAVTVSCAEGATGRIYDGCIPFHKEIIEAESLPETLTNIYLNVADPEMAFQLAMLPVDGVGLARMEFMYANWIKAHPLALLHPEQVGERERKQIADLTEGYTDSREYFIDTLAQGIALLAGAFFPRPVILCFSDFKSNEYAHLVGGAAFEPKEENPMIGFRGASRYYDSRFKEAFLLEVEAVKRVRSALGFTNLRVMIPFCRTPDEGSRVLEIMRAAGLERGKDGLEVFVMAEIPSNVFLAKEYAEIFDGFSIGSNDLTQLILGIDRDSKLVAGLFDENNLAVKKAIAQVIAAAHAANRHIGICGQAPSDDPDFAAFLIKEGINSISVNADAIVRTRRRARAEERS